MANSEPWQVFAANGEPIKGRGAVEDEVVGNAGVAIAQLWLWKRDGGVIRLLLQKRAATKKRYPGCFVSSAGGHVDLGEAYIDALVREAREEIGLVLDPAKAYFVAELHTTLEPESLRRVYFCEITDDAWQPTYADGEVESTEWVAAEDLKCMFKDPDTYNIVNQGQAYFSLLTDAINRL